MKERSVSKKPPLKIGFRQDVDTFGGFSPKAFTFFRQLKRNNRKEWFEAHRQDYEQYVKRPLLALVSEMDVHLAEFAPEIIGTAKKSPFRIYRDVRFSKDKAPYKTHAAFWLYHRDAGHSVGGEAAHGGAGFYFQMSPEGTFCGGGIWMPPRVVLTRIRQSLADDTDGWEDIVLARSFRRRFGELEGDRILSRTPREFAPDHPASRWLRYQSFTAGCEIAKDDVLSARLPSILARHYLALTPFVRWLNEAVGLAAAQYR